MYIGLTISTFLHLTLLGWALISFQATPQFKIPEPEPVEVALISPDELVRLTLGDRDSKNLKTRFAEQPEEVQAKKEAPKARVETVPPPAAAPEPPPESPDDIAKKLAALQEPEPKGPTAEELAAAKAAADKVAAEKAAAELAMKKAAEEEKKRKAEAEKKRKEAEAEKKRKEAERKKKLAEERRRKLAEQQRKERERQAKQFDPGRISALLNKIPDAKAPAAGSQDPANVDQSLPRGAQAGAPEGRDTRLTASQASLLGSMMKRAVSRCWNINSGLEGIEGIVIDIEIRLRPDGRLDGQPKVITRGNGALFQDAAINAMRALVQCEPYDLPRDLYKGGWNHMVVTFDPQKMF